MNLFTCDLTTGRNIIPLPASDGRWEVRANRWGDITAEITLAPKAHRRLDLAQNAAAGRTILGIGEGDTILEAGPIWEHDYDEDTRRLRLTGEGMWSLLMRRFVMPSLVETTNLLLTSGDNEGKPNPAVATAFTGKTWPQIVRGILEQGFARTGGNLPIVFGAAGTGAHDKSYDAAAFKPQGEALLDLTELVDGPEIDFRPQRTADRLGIEFLARVSDDSRPELAAEGLPHRFDFSAPMATVRGLKVKTSARELASEAWATGGRQSAVALIARAASDALHAAGFPRMESLSDAHSTVELQPTLDAYAQSDLRMGSALTQWWSFETNIDAVPRLGSFWLGDYCDVVMRGSAYVPDGTYRRRVAALSGDLRSRWVRVTTEEVISW